MNRNIIAILRGVKPDQVEAIGQILVDSGISKIEVPLNSPEPFESIKVLAQSFGSTATVGAGTVLTVEAVERVAEAGGTLVVSPNTDRAVIKASRSLSLLSYPGAMTPTECFEALDAGATGLKLFPGVILQPVGLSAIKAVLPENTELIVVGGVDSDNLGEWLAVGAHGFGIGSSLYHPTLTLRQIEKNARALVEQYDRCLGLTTG